MHLPQLGSQQAGAHAFGQAFSQTFGQQAAFSQALGHAFSQQATLAQGFGHAFSQQGDLGASIALAAATAVQPKHAIQKFKTEPLAAQGYAHQERSKNRLAFSLSNNSFTVKLWVGEGGSLPTAPTVYCARAVEPFLGSILYPIRLPDAPSRRATMAHVIC